jgi:hypothetical protein
LASVLVHAGCSFVLVDVPKQRGPTTRVYCPVAAPIADTLGALLGLGAFGGLVGDAIGSGRFGELLHGGGTAGTGAENSLVLPMLAIGAVYLASAIYGYRGVARCD